MAGVQDPMVIDVVGQDASGEYVVIMVEERPWDADPRQPMQLREKVNAYAGFILGGTLAQHYPQTAGHRVRVQLNCPQEPSGDIAIIAEHARAQLEKLGIGFTVRVLPPPDAPRASARSS